MLLKILRLYREILGSSGGRGWRIEHRGLYHLQSSVFFESSDPVFFYWKECLSFLLRTGRYGSAIVNVSHRVLFVKSLILITGMRFLRRRTRGGESVREINENGVRLRVGSYLDAFLFTESLNLRIIQPIKINPILFNAFII